MEKIVHIFDDDKFIDLAIPLFEQVLPDGSVYLVLKSDGEPLRHVKSRLVRTVMISDEASLASFVSRFGGHAIFFFHALNAPKQQIVNALPARVFKVWFIWGFDLYSNWKPLGKQLFEPKTSDFLRQQQRKNTWREALTVNVFTRLALNLLDGIGSSPLDPLRDRLLNYYGRDFYLATRKVDMVVPVVPTEADVVRKLYIKPKSASFTYGTLEDLLASNTVEICGKNILVGNSGDPTNNHVDVFEKLSELDLGSRKVIVPLSYGGKQAYREFVVERGKQLLGTHFVPLADFMPLEEYVRLLSSCDTLIFNHQRQQGVGNIIIMGFLGCKLFLHPKSPVLQYYRAMGFEVFSTRQLDRAHLDVPLTDAAKQRNAALFMQLYSREAVLQKTRDLIDAVFRESAAKQAQRR